MLGLVLLLGLIGFWALLVLNYFTISLEVMQKCVVSLRSTEGTSDQSLPTSQLGRALVVCLHFSKADWTVIVFLHRPLSLPEAHIYELLTGMVTCSRFCILLDLVTQWFPQEVSLIQQ